MTRAMVKGLKAKHVGVLRSGNMRPMGSNVMEGKSMKQVRDAICNKSTTMRVKEPLDGGVILTPIHCVTTSQTLCAPPSTPQPHPTIVTNLAPSVWNRLQALGEVG